MKNIFTASLAAAAFSCADSNSAKKETRSIIEPGEQTPLADPGQNNFGGPVNRDTTGRAARRKAMMEEMNRIRTQHFNDLAMSDPFIFPDPETKTYYLTSTGGRLYKIGDYYYYAGTWNDHNDLIQQVPRRYNVPRYREPFCRRDEQSRRGDIRPQAHLPCSSC